MINLFDKTLRLLSITVLVGTLFVSCSNDNKELENAQDNTETTETTEDVLTAKTNSQKLATASAELSTADDNKSDWNQNEAYDLTQVDVPPLFDSSCSTADNPKGCSEQKLLSFISKNIKKPKGRNKKSLEQVLVVIEKDGSLQGLQYVASGNKDGCPECQQAAIDVIGKIKNWVPAMKDGKPVAAKMAIPVKFG